MKTSPFISTLAAALLWLSAQAGETNVPTLAIYTADTGRFSTNIGPQIIAALWNDGRAVSSEDSLTGGPPYRQGRFAPAKLESLLDSLERQGVFTNATFKRAWFGPDAAYTTIAIEDGRRRLWLQSWHELFEQNTNLVATTGGVTPLRGRSRAAVLEEQPETYRRFRSTWEELRQAVAALLPPTGEPFEGEIQLPKR